MQANKIIKFNLYMSGILLLAFVLMLMGATVAYFTSTKQATATFTSGNVRITLSEAAVKQDAAGNLVEDTQQPRIFGAAENTVINDYGKVYPGQSIWKDPTITNITNTSDEEETITNTDGDPVWIAAKVTLTDGAGDLTRIMGYEGFGSIDIEVLLSGGLLDETVHFGTWNGIENVCHNDRYAMIQIPNAAEGEYTFYFLMLQPLEAGKSVVLFDQIAFPEEWNNEEMKQLADLKIHIQAFGVQLYQMDSCLEAMTAAFPSHFDFN